MRLYIRQKKQKAMDVEEIIESVVTPFGSGAHIIVPKRYVHRGAIVGVKKEKKQEEGNEKTAAQ